MQFELFRLGFEYVARKELHFPAGRVGNIIRGSLGMALRRRFCVPECASAIDCPRSGRCEYPRLFEPVRGREGPSGFADLPRPFAIRARPLEDLRVPAGGHFGFHLHVFSAQRDFAWRYAEAARLLRDDAELVGVSGAETPVIVPLDGQAEPLHRLRVHFLSPTELKHGGELCDRPDFDVLLRRVRDRVGSLCARYGSGPLEVDFRAMGERAARVRTIGVDLRPVHIRRRSSRTGQTHSLGGFVGRADYEGNLTEFLPWLEAAHFTGVGRHAAWGNGEIAVSCLPSPAGNS